ncbi:MAG: LCP family protein [Clostridia bacterium]|nr:LCP family protein [Clostridia bacterium]
MKQKKAHRYSTAARVWTIVGSSFMALLGVLCITAGVLLDWGYGLMQQDTGGDVPHHEQPVIPEEEPDDPSENPDYQQGNQEDVDSGSELQSIPIRGNQSGVRNILLLGIDSKTFSGRSDTMMILSINDNTKTIKLVSFLRDTWATIPGRDKDGDMKDDVAKLNAAYAYGKSSLLRKTLEQNFRLDIDDYIGVNFAVLPKVIDAVGGIDVKLTAKEMSQIPANGCYVAIPTPGKDCDGQGGFVSLKGAPGTYHLNGFQAMQYARIRKLDSDFKRTERQREVVSLLIAKAKKMSYSQLVSVLTTVLKHVETNMSQDEFLSFAADAASYVSYPVDMDYSVPQAGEYTGTYINGGAGLLLHDPKKTVEALHKHLYG